MDSSEKRQLSFTAVDVISHVCYRSGSYKFGFDSAMDSQERLARRLERAKKLMQEKEKRQKEEKKSDDDTLTATQKGMH